MKRQDWEMKDPKISRKVVERREEEWKPSRVTTNTTSSVKIWGQLNGESENWSGSRCGE